MKEAHNGGCSRGKKKPNKPMMGGPDVILIRSLHQILQVKVKGEGG